MIFREPPVIIRTFGQPKDSALGRNGLATYFPFFGILRGLGAKLPVTLKVLSCGTKEETSWESDNSRNVSLVAQAHELHCMTIVTRCYQL